MTNIISVSIPEEMYRDIVERQKKDRSGFGWSHIFKVGYMRVTSDHLGDVEDREETKKKVEKIVQKLDYYVRRTNDLEQQIYTLGQKPKESD